MSGKKQILSFKEWLNKYVPEANLPEHIIEYAEAIIKGEVIGDLTRMGYKNNLTELLCNFRIFTLRQLLDEKEERK